MSHQPSLPWPFAVLLGAALVLGIAWSIFNPPKKPDQEEFNKKADETVELIKEGSAHVTRKAGEHFTKGVIKGVKDEVKDSAKKLWQKVRGGKDGSDKEGG